MTGDLVIVKEVDVDELQEGDIIAFRSDDIVITHRIVDIIEEDGVKKFETKGDNNNSKDSGYVTADQIEGKFVLKISKLGNLAMFVQTPTGIIACLAIPIILLILVELQTSVNKNKAIIEKENKQKELENEMEKLKKENEELLKNKDNK